jgi:hypothetical protein
MLAILALLAIQLPVALATTPLVACVTIAGFPYAWPGKKILITSFNQAVVSIGE